MNRLAAALPPLRNPKPVFLDLSDLVQETPNFGLDFCMGSNRAFTPEEATLMAKITLETAVMVAGGVWASQGTVRTLDEDKG